MNNRPTHTADAVVIGGGLIGLACAVAAAERGLTITLVGARKPGDASRAAAGILAPSIERGEGAAHAFAVAARDRYPDYLDWLAERTGHRVPLSRDGVLQVALNDRAVRSLRRALPDEAEWLDASALAAIEPALSHAQGAALHPTDGAVDNVLLIDALHAAATSHPRIALVDDVARAVRLGHTATVAGSAGATYEAPHVVLAAGAWSPLIEGLPRAIPVEPVRGQMLAYASGPLRRVVYGPTGYLVPRVDGRTLVGATMERVAFDASTTDAATERLRRTAAEIAPSLGALTPTHVWAGLRPISMDLQPILGPDPDEPSLIYATGHSRNGVLMTPLTGDCIAALLAGDPPPADLAPFRIARFG